MKNTNSFNFYNNLLPSQSKDQNSLNGGIIKNLNSPTGNNSMRLDENIHGHFYSHQPKVIARSNMELFNGYSNISGSSFLNSGGNLGSYQANSQVILKKESPKNQTKLFQDFQTLYLNSPSNVQRSSNVISTSFSNSNKNLEQHLSHQNQSLQNATSVGQGNSINSISTNLLKANNSRLLFPSQQVISSLSQQQTAHIQTNSPYTDFKNFSRVQVNNFFSGNGQEKRKEEAQQKNSGESKGLSSTLYNSMHNVKLLQENNIPGANVNNLSGNSSLPKRLSKDFDANNNGYLSNVKQQYQSQQGISQIQQNQQGYSPKQSSQVSSSTNSLFINNTKDNTNSFSYQNIQTPTSDRNWKNVTQKNMNVTQTKNTQNKKKDDQYYNTYESISKPNIGYQSPYAVLQANYAKQNSSPRNQTQTPQTVPTQENKGSINSYITKLNRGDDLIGQALQNSKMDGLGTNNRMLMRSGTYDGQDSSIASFQGDSTITSNGIKKDSKSIANSLRNSTFINQNNSIGNDNGANGQGMQMRCNSAKKEYNTQQGGYLSAAQQKPYNLTLANQNNWTPFHQKPSTAKENKAKNFLFFENSNILNGNKQQTPQNESQTPQSQGANKQNGYSRQSSNQNIDKNNASRVQQSQINSDNTSRCVTPKVPIHQGYYMDGIEKCYKLPLPQDYFSQIYREHFFQTFQGIQYSQIARPANPHDLQSKKVFLKSKQPGKKTLIFDLDETLIHCNENPNIPSDVVLSIRFPQGEVLNAGINVRPYAVEMLKELCTDFEIVVFTASHSSYAKAVLDHLDPHKRYIHHRYFRDQCIQTPQGVYIKDLRIFADRSMSEMVLVDNAAYSFAFQVENGIPIIPFYENKKDEELKSLTNYLKSLKDVKDVREINKQAFKFHMYSQFEAAQKLYDKLFPTQQSITKIASPSKPATTGSKTSINNYFLNKNSPTSNLGGFQQKQPNFNKSLNK